MKKIVLIVTLLLIGTFSVYFCQSAQANLLKPDAITNLENNTQNIASQAEYQVSEDQPLEVFLGRMIRIALSIVGMIFIIFMFLAGNDWMQAAGNEEKVKHAKARIQSLLIGLVIILISFALSYGFSSILSPLLKQ